MPALFSFLGKAPSMFGSFAVKLFFQIFVAKQFVSQPVGNNEQLGIPFGPRKLNFPTIDLDLFVAIDDDTVMALNLLHLLGFHEDMKHQGPLKELRRSQVGKIWFNVARIASANNFEFDLNKSRFRVNNRPDAKSSSHRRMPVWLRLSSHQELCILWNKNGLVVGDLKLVLPNCLCHLLPLFEKPESEASGFEPARVPT